MQHNVTVRIFFIEKEINFCITTTSTNTGTGSGSTCAIECLSGYQVSGGEATCSLGAWQTPLPQCSPRDCTHTLSIANLDSASTSCSGTSSGQTCSFFCNAGYHPSGTLRCTLGNFNDDEVSCNPDPCDSDPDIQHISTASSSCEDTRSGLSCIYECESGYRRGGDAVAYCTFSSNPLPFSLKLNSRFALKH